MTTHTLHFETPPSNEELRVAVQNLGLHCYRFTEVSPDKLSFTVEKVDISSFQEEKSRLIAAGVCRAFPAILSCGNCGEDYKGWQVLRPEDTSHNRVRRFYTFYCPACPPVSTDLWLKEKAHILKERPEGIPVFSPSLPGKKRIEPTLTITTDDLDDFV